MAIAATMFAGGTGGFLLHGITHAELAGAIGHHGAEFSGVRVRPIVEGSIAALVSDLPPAKNWLDAVRRRLTGTRSLLPTLSAMASILPIVPTQPGTRFCDEGSVRKLLAGRAQELDEIVLRHSAFLECELSAQFDTVEAENDLIANTSLGALQATSPQEAALVRQTLTQSIAGRQAVFIARLRRLINDIAADITISGNGTGPSIFSRRILLARSSRRELRERVAMLQEEIGSGARLSMGSLLPPLSFRRLEVRGANIADVIAAREALGVEDSADRMMIRVAYRRSLERIAPVSGGAQRDRMDRLNAHFGLLDLVAEGQLRAGRSSGAQEAQFDAQSLADTWLIKLHVHDVADRVA